MHAYVHTFIHIYLHICIHKYIHKSPLILYGIHVGSIKITITILMILLFLLYCCLLDKLCSNHDSSDRTCTLHV